MDVRAFVAASAQLCGRHPNGSETDAQCKEKTFKY